MPKISNRPLTILPRTRIWADDYEYLQQLFSNSELGFAGAIREILSEYVTLVRSRADRNIDHQASSTHESLPIDDEILKVIRGQP